jgi:hypothetical protein
MPSNGGESVWQTGSLSVYSPRAAWALLARMQELETRAGSSPRWAVHASRGPTRTHA